MLISLCLIHVYSSPIDNPRHHFSSWRHLGTLSASMGKQLKLYIWRLHPQLPNGFKRHPEYSSFLFLWVPGQLDSNVKDRCKLRNGTGWRPIYLCFKSPLLGWSPPFFQYWSAYNLCEYKALFQLHWGRIVWASPKTAICLHRDCSF